MTPGGYEDIQKYLEGNTTFLKKTREESKMIYEYIFRLYLMYY